MMHISWQKEYSVNVEVIDEQHRHFFDLLNKAYDCLSSLKSDSDVKALLEKLGEHVEVHFGFEEDCFNRFHCENIEEEVHREKHREFKEKVSELKRRYAGGQTDLAVDMVELMEDWFLQHIMVYDKKYSECFNAHGLY